MEYRENVGNCLTNTRKKRSPISKPSSVIGKQANRPRMRACDLARARAHAVNKSFLSPEVMRPCAPTAKTGEGRKARSL